MQIRLAATAAVVIAIQAQTPQDASPEDAAPADFAPEDGGETFSDWCVQHKDCWGKPDEAFPSGPGIEGVMIRCSEGFCECSGDYYDAGAAENGQEYAGWSCMPNGEAPPSIPMEYSCTWPDDQVSFEQCRGRPADFDANVRQSMKDFYRMEAVEMTPGLCGSIHYVMKGQTTVSGKSGFAQAFASNPNNPYGAPTVVATKAALVATNCVPVSPVVTMALIAGICQPLSCIEGYTLVGSGTVTEASQCVVNPPPGVPATLAPTPDNGGRGIVYQVSEDDTLSYGAVFGVAFGIAVGVAIIAAIIGYMYKQKQDAAAAELEQENNLNAEQENNGPDKEEHQEDPLV